MSATPRDARNAARWMRDATAHAASAGRQGKALPHRARSGDGADRSRDASGSSTAEPLRQPAQCPPGLRKVAMDLRQPPRKFRINAAWRRSAVTSPRYAAVSGQLLPPVTTQDDQVLSQGVMRSEQSLVGRGRGAPATSGTRRESVHGATVLCRELWPFQQRARACRPRVCSHRRIPHMDIQVGAAWASLARALRMTSILRMVATTATLPGFPRARRDR